MAFTLLSACAAKTAYVAEPVDPAAFPKALSERRLEPLPAGRTWTDADLLAASLDRSPSLISAAAAYRAALAAGPAARARQPITYNLQTEYANEADKSSPWLFGASADIPLDRGRLREARFAAADLAGLAARYDYGEALWAVRDAIRRAHVEWIAADRQLALSERLIAIRRTRLARLEQRVSAGEDARQVTLLAQSELSAAMAQRDATLAAHAQAEAALSKALGAPISAVRGLALAPLADPEAVAPTQIPVWRSESLLSRTDVMRGLAQYDEAEAALRLEVARQYPQVTVSPGYTWERGLTKLPFSLSLVLPRDGNRPAIAEAEAKRAQAGRVIEALQADAFAAVDRSTAAIGATKATLDRVRSADIPRSERLRDMMQRSLALGETDRLELEAAEAAIVEAQLSEVEAWKQAWLAEADLENALRRPADAAETTLLAQAMARLKEAR